MESSASDAKTEMSQQALSIVTEPASSASPHYGLAISSMQRGDWPAALQTLARLREQFPDETELEELYQEVQFKAELDTRHAAWVATCAAVRRQRRRARRAAILGVALMVFLIGVFVFQQRIHPVFNESRSAAEQRRLLQAGTDALKADDPAAAVANFEALLALAPNHQGASEGLARARQQLALATLYDEGLQLVAQMHWTEAESKFEEIVRQAPHYRDAAQQLARVRTQIQLVLLLQSGQASFQAQDWRAAIESLETLRRLDPAYATETVEEYLYLSYQQRARQLLADAGDSVTAVQTAANLLDQAIKLRPQADELQAEYRLVSTYLDGLTFSAAGRRAEAITRFQAVYDAQPNFAGGRVGQRLVGTLLQQGDDLLAVGEHGRALESYRRAQTLPDARDAEILPRLFKALALLADAEAQRNDHKSAVEHYREAVKAGRPAFPADIAAQLMSYVDQAEAQARRGAFQEAARLYHQMVELLLKNSGTL